MSTNLDVVACVAHDDVPEDSAIVVVQLDGRAGDSFTPSSVKADTQRHWRKRARKKNRRKINHSRYSDNTNRQALAQTVDKSSQEFAPFNEDGLFNAMGIHRDDGLPARKNILVIPQAQRTESTQTMNRH